MRVIALASINPDARTSKSQQNYEDRMKTHLPLNWAPSPGFRGLCSPSHNITASTVGGRGLKDCPLIGFMIIPKASLGERQWLLLRPQRGQIRLSGSGLQRQRSMLEGGCFKSLKYSCRLTQNQVIFQFQGCKDKSFKVWTFKCALRKSVPAYGVLGIGSLSFL